ncbi:MAG: YaiI/YqxD family protein [Planctomycetes bacterium]|nr:YaiI/YqxD family protein [Planctomycetota bacterium]
MLHIYIDADACPVKDETYRVAKRYGLSVTVVANQWMNMPNDPTVRLEVVDDGFDAADDWIVAHVGKGDIVISEDIPLAARCLAKGARVITGRGSLFDADSIGSALASRELMQYLRGAGDVRGGPKPMQASDRNAYLQALDKLIHAVKKHG